MYTLFHSISRAFSSLFIARVFKLLLLSMLLNALVIGLLGGASFLLFDGLVGGQGIVGWVLNLLFGIAQVAIAAFIFPLLLPVIISFFAENIAEAIEEKEYPNVPVPQPPFWPTMFQEVRFVGKIIGLNILCLPLYFIPIINVATYYVLNGYLIGTEFFNLVAGRHIDLKEARIISAHKRWQIIASGIGITICATIPLLNLVTPIFAVALMVHFFHALNPKYKVLIEK